MGHQDPARRTSEDGVGRPTHHELAKRGMAVGAHHQKIGLVRLVTYALNASPSEVAFSNSKLVSNAMDRQVLRKSVPGR
jgi:hypothetical protein